MYNNMQQLFVVDFYDEGILSWKFGMPLLDKYFAKIGRQIPQRNKTLQSQQRKDRT